MTFRTLLAWLRPKPDNAVPEEERDARRLGESEVQRLRRIERLGR